MKKLVFTAKPFEGFLYKWSPDDNVIKKNKKKQNNNPTEFCNAIPFSNGFDTVSKYCYRINIVDGKINKMAYFSCGYIK